MKQERKKQKIKQNTQRERERERERETEETDKAEVKWRLWIIYHQDTKTHEK